MDIRPDTNQTQLNQKQVSLKENKSIRFSTLVTHYTTYLQFHYVHESGHLTTNQIERIVQSSTSNLFGTTALQPKLILHDSDLNIFLLKLALDANNASSLSQSWAALTLVKSVPWVPYSPISISCISQTGHVPLTLG